MKRVALHYSQTNGTLYIALYDCDLHVGGIKVVKGATGARDVATFLETSYTSPVLVGVSKWQGCMPWGRIQLVFIPHLFNPAYYLFIHYRSSRVPTGGYVVEWRDDWRCVVRAAEGEWKVNLRNLTCSCCANRTVPNEHELCEHLKAAYYAVSDEKLALLLRSVDEYEWRAPSAMEGKPVAASVAVNLHKGVGVTMFDAQVYSDGSVELFVRIGETVKVARYANLDEFIGWFRSALAAYVE